MSMDASARHGRVSGPIMRTGNAQIKRGKVSPKGAGQSHEAGAPRRVSTGTTAPKLPPEIPNPEDVEWFSWAETQLKQIAGKEGKITREKFIAAVNAKQNFFTERFFTITDKDNLGIIKLEEMIKGLEFLAKADITVRLSFLFDAYDVEDKGYIEKDRFRTLLSTCIQDSALRISDAYLDALTDTLYENANRANKGGISYEEFYMQLRKHPGVIRNLSISAKAWLTQSNDQKATKDEMPQDSNPHRLGNNIGTIICVVLYWLLNGALIGISIYRHIQENFCLIIARACGMCLNFNCVFALVLMLRYCFTWLRNTKVGQYVPFNARTMFHNMVGVVVLVLAVIHSCTHIGNIALLKSASANFTNVTNSTNSSIASLAYWEILFTTRSGTGSFGFGFAYLSGMILTVILFIICVFSIPSLRGSGHFEVFYWTHLLYLAFFALLIIHGPIFWMFLVGPGVIFAVEKFKTMCQQARDRNYVITRVNLLPSKVTHLVISRPPSFKYRPGDYIFINIPAIASHEWHPFAISSSPESQDELWLHIRSTDPWSSRLYDFFDKYVESEGIVNRAAVISHDGRQTRVLLETMETGMYSNYQNNKQDTKAVCRCSVAKVKKTHLKVFIDGPYGLSSHKKIFEAEHVVLITSGMGAAPYASILQSIVRQAKSSYSECPGCSMEWYDHEKKKNNIKKVDFIWINPDQKSFEWFISLLVHVELELRKKKGSVTDFLEIQIFLTAASNRKDLKGVGLQIAMDVLSQKEDGNVASNMKITTESGRPNFDEVFSKIAVAGMGEIKVFFCGARHLAKCIKKNCRKHGFKFSRERF